MRPSKVRAGIFPALFFTRITMMPAKMGIAPEVLAEGKYLYEETLTPIGEILTRMGISRSTFYARVHEYGWVRRRYSNIAEYTGVQPPSAPERAPAESAGTQPPPVSELAPPVSGPVPAAPDNAGSRATEAVPDATEAAAAKQVTPAQRIALSVRVYDAAQRQMDAIESIQQTLRPTKEIQSERKIG